ncbi:MAG: hypothetical protein WCG67_03275 [Ferruginibacter sp.]
MTKPVLLFAVKCAIIVYFAAFSNIQKLGVSTSVSDLVTKGSWRVNCYDNAQIDKTCIFNGYTFSFDASGKVVASKNGQLFEGNWLEDNISKKITFSFNNINPALTQLNNHWAISNISGNGITFESNNNQKSEKLYISTY